ncbi:MAG: transporter substrate-binding domain-containing protein [Oscillospiraceae bacterium]|nr:transporter substrate-binding domain-containing protein [Oscillospiraceae bacterium]
MKKLIALILTTLLVLSCLTACSSGKTLADIEKAGKLTVATSPDFPPFEYLDENSAVVGIEIDILTLVCEELGVELDIQQMDFDSVLPGVQTGKYDLGASGISVTPDREENTLFTVPYCMAAQAIVVLKDSAITCKADLDGKIVAVQTGTTAEEFCMGAGYDVNAYTANTDAQQALLSGKVDAWVIDDLTAADMVKLYNAENGETLVVLSEAMTSEPYAFAFMKGSEDLAEPINEVLKKLLDDGTIADIFAKYEAPYTAPNAG